MTFADVDISKVRKFWDKRPCNLKHSDKPVGTREYFDEVEHRKYTVEPHIPDFADFPRWAGKYVLEIGCGIGTDTVNFARHAASVRAVDLSGRSVELTRQRLDVYGLQNNTMVAQLDAERLDETFAGPLFDLVYSFGVIHHSPHPQRVLDQAYHVTKPGGTLKVMVYHRRSWKVLWILVRYGWGRWWRVAEVVAEHSEAQTGCPITYTYTRRQAQRMVEAAGFDVREVRVDHIFPYRIRSYRHGQLVKTWYWRLIPQSLFRKLERTLGWHLLITAVKP